MARPEPVSLIELRILDGPNLYFTRPAVKLTMAVPGWIGAPEERVSALAARLGVRGADSELAGGPRLRPGARDSDQRRRFVARLAAHVTRTLASLSRTNLAVRARAGPELDQIVVAFPWRRRGAAEALGRELSALFGEVLYSRRPPDRLLAGSAARVAAAEPGPPPVVSDPKVPVIAVTGTNGKTTVVRLLAHLVQAAGMNVAYSSTDGVYFNGRLVEAGDYSGFGGAARALAQPEVQVAVLETARGGILLRGIGALHNDVAVVTNISADHLGLHGIRTLDQLAEVKAAITHITRPGGWDVLNADDPRVLAMRRGIRGRPWLYSMDHDHPAIRTALSEGGRAVTLVDRRLTVLMPGGRSRSLVPIEDVPLTLAGISRHYTQNAMAATAAALGIGLPEESVVRGLLTFVLDPDSNPGRTNLFELGGRIVVADYAHNEAGLAGLVATCRGLRPPGSEVWLAFGTAGDRTNEILHTMGYTAGRGSDHVAVAELVHYLRGRGREDLASRLQAGALDGGAREAPIFEDEVHALEWMLERSRPDDVVAVTALSQRAEVFALLEERGAMRIGPARVKKLVHRARGAA
jgi:cyanophycin synthetase